MTTALNDSEAKQMIRWARSSKGRRSMKKNAAAPTARAAVVNQAASS